MLLANYLAISSWLPVYQVLPGYSKITQGNCKHQTGHTVKADK